MPVNDLLKYAGYTTELGLKNTYNAVTALVTEGVAGVFVEAGVGSGSQIGVMLQALQDLGARRTIHLFDSFEGIGMAGPKDIVQPGISATLDPKQQARPLDERPVSSGISAHSATDVKRFITSYGHSLHDCVFHEGWVEKTLPPETPVGDIALLRIDVDMYSPTRHALEHLYDSLVPGGMLILDDYSYPVVDNVYNQVQQAVKDFFDSRSLPIPELEGPTDYGLACCRK